jgi:hypothetical protein
LPYEFYNNNDSNYKPSELSKFLVSLIGKYDLEDDDYFSDDIYEKFRNINNIITSNNKSFINEDSKLIIYLDKVINPYFMDIYKIVINNIIYSKSSFENYILSQYINLEILKLLLEKYSSNVIS